MADLYIDADELERMRASLELLRGQLDRPGRELARIDAASAGTKELNQRLGDFGAEWSYAGSKIAQFGGSASEAIRYVQRHFDEVEAALGRAFGDGPANPGP